MTTISGFPPHGGGRPRASVWVIIGTIAGVIGAIAGIYFGITANSSSSTTATAAPNITVIAQEPAAVNPATYIGHIVEWTNGGGQPNTSWLVGSNGERYWIPTTGIFFCLENEGHTDLGPQSSAVLSDLPDSGQWASCP